MTEPTGPTSTPTDVVGSVLGELAGAGGLDVLDVGGGSGTRAVPLAVQGCRVTVVDPSIDALATLRRRANEAGVGERVRGVQADTDALGAAIQPSSADLVLCHHVLEFLDDPAAALDALAAALRPGGTLSLLVAGRNAAVLALGIAGRFAAAAAAAGSPDGRFGDDDPLRRRFDSDGLSTLLTDAGLRVVSLRGVGVVSGLVPGALIQASVDGAADLAKLERELSQTPPLRDIATDLHLLATPVAS